MRLLLDTHVLLWWIGSPASLSEKTQQIVTQAEVVAVSVVSVWEIEIKRALGKLSAPADTLDRIAVNGFQLLPITGEHAVAAGRLPRHHNDPFDRMLVAQASIESLVVVTRDARFRDYGVALLPA